MEAKFSNSTERVRAFSQMARHDLFLTLETEENGLTNNQAQTRLEKMGRNEVASERPPSWYALLWLSYFNPFNVLLTTLGLITYLLDDLDGTIIILTMVFLSVAIRFIQELRSTFSAEKLKSMVKTRATVLRRSDFRSPVIKKELPIEELVPGDVVFLSAGDMIPADLLLISSKGLFLSQSVLSGESLPVEKSDRPSQEISSSVLELANICFMGTNVVNGTGIGVVISTGNETYFGSMAKTIIGARPLTSFDIGIQQVSWLLIRTMFVMVPIVFFINGFTKGNWFDSLLFAVSVAVGLIPEMLPMIVTTNLTKGAVTMAKSKVIVKRLNSIQNFGAMNILCTDKTGTLTQDRIILEKHVDLQGEEDSEVLKYGYLNSFWQTGLKNLMDIAILENKELEKEINPEKSFPKIDEIPFDFERRRMSVVVREKASVDILITKGAVDEIIDLCASVKEKGESVPLSAVLKKEALSLCNQLNEDGLRVLAVANRLVPIREKPDYSSKDEHSLTLLGFLAFLDPPKQTAQKALTELKKLHVDIKVLTGDTEIITRTICKWVGLEIEGSLTGSVIDSMSDDLLLNKIDQTTIFTKVSPHQKARIISLLRQKGHTVGFLGDGINDAPGLRQADIGISVDTAVDIAKESADIIMLEKSLLFLAEGVIEGRKTFGNILKYIKMAVSSNFGNVFSIVGSSLLLPFLPMMPLQLLVQNLLYDISQISIPFDSVDADFLEYPRKWDPKGIAKFMVVIGPISSLFDYTTFAILWFFFLANSVETAAFFQTGWFIEGLLSQTFIVHMIRTKKIPFLQSIASPPLLATTFLIMAAGIYIPYSLLGKGLGMVPMPTSYFYWLAATLFCYAAVVQIVKVWFIRKFHYWL